MPASHDHDDEAFDATDDDTVDVSLEEEAALTQEQLDRLDECGFR